MGKNRFKAAPPNQGAVVKAIDTVNHDERPPFFSLERLQGGDYCFDNLDCQTACKTFQGPWEKSVEKFPPQVVQ